MTEYLLGKLRTIGRHASTRTTERGELSPGGERPWRQTTPQGSCSSTTGPWTACKYPLCAPLSRPCCRLQHWLYPAPTSPASVVSQAFVSLEFPPFPSVWQTVTLSLTSLFLLFHSLPGKKLIYTGEWEGAHISRFTY